MAAKRKQPLATSVRARNRQRADQAVLTAAEAFIQQWIAHPRDVMQIGHDHAELIRVVLNRRAAWREQ